MTKTQKGLLMGLLLVAGILIYYFKIYKPKNKKTTTEVKKETAPLPTATTKPDVVGIGGATPFVPYVNKDEVDQNSLFFA